MNSVSIMGRLTADPELKKTPSDISVCSFTIAVDRAYVKAGEERQADFIDVVAWRNNAEFVSKHFHKGSMIGIEGYLQTRTYEDKQGNKRKATEVIVEKTSFCGSKETRSADVEVEDSFNELPDPADLPF